MCFSHCLKGLTEQISLLQCVLTGRAQEAFASLGDTYLMYETVKFNVLNAYELVPEAYRQRFRTWEKQADQSHMEFAREQNSNFNHWCVASDGVFDLLCNLVVLEQFKNSLPKCIATYLAECRVKTVAEAAEVADKFELIHKNLLVTLCGSNGDVSLLS